MRLAILSSHEGSLLQLVMDACAAKQLPASVELVISNNSTSRAYARARDMGVDTLHLSKNTHPDADLLDQAMLSALISHGVTLVLLAGYMRRIGPATLAHYKGRIINTHPSLLPKFGGQGFYGRHVHEAVLAAGESVTGASVHWVTNEYDEGAVIAQTSVPVLPEDNALNIEDRVKAVERDLLLDTLSKLANCSIPSNA
ncbi:MAG: phosphoribosylglycinamide formyltransferase [Pseudomonadales bacterium]|nr:phosphoribosylglycinamide formyltransferase [Pseudomonadales bacterium]